MKKTSSPSGSGSAERYMIPVVTSTFRVLEELSKSGALGLNDVTIRTGVSTSTVFRILTTLTLLGYVVRDTDRSYYISHTLSGLMSELATVEALRRAALPHMLKLRDEYGETVNLGQLQFDKVVYVEVVPSEFALRLHERAGATVCAHASALGKAILAFSPAEMVEGLLQGRELQMFTHNTITDPDKLIADLRRVREHGYALDRGEISLLASCVAAPILDGHGIALAAISISGPSSRFSPRSNSPVIESLLIGAAETSKHFRSRAPQQAEADVTTELVGAGSTKRRR